MFAAYKIAVIILQPSFLAALAMAAGLTLLTLSHRRRLALRLAWGGLLYLIVFGIVPLGNALILPLEQHLANAPIPKPGDDITGIIILGGFEDGWVTAGRGQLTVNESAERLTEGVKLARALPASKVLFSGGVGAIWNGGETAAGPVADYLAAVGINRSRVLLEGRSRNTIENATYSAELVHPAANENWVLVTSAYHMPRALGLFRKAGFTIRPWPVDYRTRGWQDVWRFSDRLPAGHQRLDLAVTEWAGLIAARLSGHIERLFPDA